MTIHKLKTELESRTAYRFEIKSYLPQIDKLYLLGLDKKCELHCGVGGGNHPYSIGGTDRRNSCGGFAAPITSFDGLIDWLDAYAKKYGYKPPEQLSIF